MNQNATFYVSKKPKGNSLTLPMLNTFAQPQWTNLSSFHHPRTREAQSLYGIVRNLMVIWTSKMNMHSRSFSHAR